MHFWVGKEQGRGGMREEEGGFGGKHCKARSYTSLFRLLLLVLILCQQNNWSRLEESHRVCNCFPKVHLPQGDLPQPLDGAPAIVYSMHLLGILAIWAGQGLGWDRVEGGARWKPGCFVCCVFVLSCPFHE